MQPILALLALLSLGPEVPLGSPALRPAVGNQSLSSVASNGRGFLALWSEDTTSRPPLYTTRVDATGRPLEPTGHLIADSTFNGHLIWSGSEYLALYQLVSGGTLLQTLDDDGHPTGTPTKIDLAVAPRVFATNGGNLLTLQFSGQLWLNALDDGRALWKELLPAPTDASEIAVLPNGDYRFVALMNGDVLLIDVNGTTGYITNKRTLAHAGRMGAFVRPDGSTLVAWTEGALAKFELVDETQPVTFATDAAGVDVGVGFDGHQFGIALGSADRLRITRVTFDGRLIDATPIALSGGPASDLHIAASDTDVLIAGNVVNADVDVVGRVSHGFDDVAASQVTVIANSAEVQQRPRVADGGLVLWQERGVIMAQRPDGTPHEILSATTTPGIARGTSSYLVAWIAGNDNGGGTLFSRRLALDGTPIDRDPIALAQVDYSSYTNTDSTPAVAFDGTNFLVAWGEPTSNVSAMRVGQDGHAIDARPFSLTNFGPRADAVLALRAVWSGSVYVVAWNGQLFWNLLSPGPPQPAHIKVVRVAASGQVLDAQPLDVWQKPGLVDSIGLAVNGDGVELVWSLDCAYELPLHNDGTPARADVHALDCVSSPLSRVFGAGVAWDGKEYVAVWNIDDTVKASGLSLSDETVAVSTGASQPSIAASATGATIAYIRVDQGVTRVFTRTIDVRGVPPRRRTSD